ncbi:glycoside hydrolase superfamily [Phakopsora pachyrhizi]|nr:glycoside hydrolase superfamily [Phakopsora pachyrhizi]
MVREFSWMKEKKGARYVRLYGGCDSDSFNNDVIEAAAKVGVGVFSLIWFGFDGDDKWRGRKQRLMESIKKNPKAPYVIRAVTCGSEPLYDGVLPVNELVKQIEDLKKQLNPLGISVTLSEMPAGYKKFNDTPEIFSAVDFVSLHSFPFFEGNATTADQSLSTLERDIGYGKFHGGGKRVIITQTGWPSNSDTWKPNSPRAVVSVEQSEDYFDLLDSQCENFRTEQIAWFSHIYNETSLAGWGIVDQNGTEKFEFRPRSFC